MSTVALADEHDPVAMWLRAQARPFYDREAYNAAPRAAAPVVRVRLSAARPRGGH